MKLCQIQAKFIDEAEFQKQVGTLKGIPLLIPKPNNKLGDP
jgi:hypothetical protein